MSNLRHPNIVRFLGACLEPLQMSILFELCATSLFEVLHARQRGEKPQPPSLGHREAWGSPTHLGAPPERLGGVRWPRQLSPPAAPNSRPLLLFSHRPGTAAMAMVSADALRYAAPSAAAPPAPLSSEQARGSRAAGLQCTDLACHP